MRHIPMFAAAVKAAAITACLAPSSVRAQTSGTQVTDVGVYAAVRIGGTDAQEQ